MTVHRYVCSVLDEMRTAVKVGRIDMLIGLIEEAQTMFNRMEAKLEDYAEMGYDLNKYKKLKKKLRELQKLDDEVDQDEFKKII